MTPASRVASADVLGLLLREGERLLAEDVLARLRGRDHLARVDRVGRRENDGVDLGVGEERLVPSTRRSIVLRGEGLRPPAEIVRVAPATKRSLSLCPDTDSTSVLPHQPSPTIAAWIISAVLHPPPLLRSAVGISE